MPVKPAIYYKRDGFDTGSRRLLGRHVASEGFLKALVQHGSAEHLYCLADRKDEFLEFCDLVRPWIIDDRKATWIPSSESRGKNHAEVLYRGDMNIMDLVWQRRFIDEKAYSICGVTHTICSLGAMSSIGNMAVAPLQPWDAIVCTSVAVKTAFEKMMHNWLEYLGQRFQCEPKIHFQLPIIPLGVDCDAFPAREERDKIRGKLRQKLGIPDSEMVVLYVGRLIHTAKANPVPMFLALEKAAQALGQRLTFLLMGWFENTQEERAFKAAVQKYCPSIRVVYVDGRKPSNRFNIWPVADIFISLADNIQETFGLTPIEAMANGLPVVVSDWDGYKETVRHGIDGFRIPTTMVPPGYGEDLAYDYLGNNFHYSQYVGNVALATVVDIEASTQALITLCQDAELRKQMGENGRNQVENVFEWKVIIQAYERLWEELSELRQSSTTLAPRQPEMPAYPLCDDPFALFSHYPTALLHEENGLAMGTNFQQKRLHQLHDDILVNPSWFRGVPDPIVTQILNQVGSADSKTMKELMASLNTEQKALVYRTIAQLQKFDILTTK